MINSGPQDSQTPEHGGNCIPISHKGAEERPQDPPSSCNAETFGAAAMSPQALPATSYTEANPVMDRETFSQQRPDTARPPSPTKQSSGVNQHIPSSGHQEPAIHHLSLAGSVMERRPHISHSDTWSVNWSLMEVPSHWKSCSARPLSTAAWLFI